ncbi:MAG: glycosyltransferase family 2 protein [Lachnospiraceae bacterium]|nr:glycosyltransferase family 2 protein [Lachnospiraceae bacterium]
MGIKSFLKQGMAYGLDKQYEKKCASRKILYKDWVASMEEAESSSTGEHVEAVFLSDAENGAWADGAKERAEAFLSAHPEVCVVYGDEDVETAPGQYENPWLKPCWSPDTYLWKDYLGEAVAVRKSFYEKAEEKSRDGLLKAAGGFTKGCQSIAHINGILFHRKTDWFTGETNSSMTREKTAGGQTDCRDAKKQGMPYISVIIPSKDNAVVLKKCLDTLKKTAADISYEVLLVDNGSGEAVKKKIEEMTADAPDILYIYEPMEFNFSKMCNLGAERAKGSLLLFLNDDIEATHTGWLSDMAKLAERPHVGAVGCKLLYPDTDKIQHAGITNLPMGPVHKLQFLRDNKCYYDNRNRGIWNVSAVTAACLMVRREVFEEAGGFCESMQVAFNDVDFCFTLLEKGYYNAVCNHIHLLHHESMSRGADESEEKLKRLHRERTMLYDRHPGLNGKDPFYHDWLNRTGLDTRIQPAYRSGREIADVQVAKEVAKESNEAYVLKNARKDRCLLVRIEAADASHISGYGVVLGSDNACFNGKLLLERKGRQPAVYELDFTEQYRQDLQENMPDQKNVALCGFHVNIAEPLPEGEYRIGMLATDKISGSSLMNYSNRTFIVART